MDRHARAPAARSRRPRSAWRCGWRSASSTGSTSRSRTTSTSTSRSRASVALGRGFVYDDAHDDRDTAQQFGRAPGYPLFWRRSAPDAPMPSATPARVKIAQSLVGALTVWLIASIALRAAGPRAGCRGGLDRRRVPAARLDAVVRVERDALLRRRARPPRSCSQRCRRIGGDQRRRPRRLGPALLAGALAGVAALMRPAMLLFLPLAAVWLAVSARGSRLRGRVAHCRRLLRHRAVDGAEPPRLRPVRARSPPKAA